MKTLITVGLAIMLSLTAFSQHTNILIGTQSGPNEPSIAINPKNTNELMAGTNLANYFYSTDAGYTWTHGYLTSQAYGVWGDPVIICDTAEAFYFFHLSNPPTGSWIDRIVCQKVDEPGGTWNDGTYMGLNGYRAQDKEWAVVDRTNNNIYVTWTQFDDYGSSNPEDVSKIRFSKTTDGGMNWSEAISINEVDGDCIDSDNTTEGAVPAVGPNGEVYVSWAGPAGLVFDRSLDQGETWLDEDIFVNDMPGGWDMDIPGIMRCNGMPITVCDLSGGPNHGTIYICWADIRNGESDPDIWLTKSTDGGDTWAEQIRVNDDEPGNYQFFPWMAIDQVTGHLWFVYYDRRNYTDNNTDVYMAVSRDGGDSFTNFKVSDEPFIPWSSIFFGDYNNITAHNDVIRPIWIRLHGGDRSVWTAIVDPQIVGLEEEYEVPFSIEKNYPNPFQESTHIAFKLRKTTELTLAVRDVYGREVARIFNNRAYTPGKHTVAFHASDHNLISGVYYFVLISEENTFKRKAILLQ